MLQVFSSAMLMVKQRVCAVMLMLPLLLLFWFRSGTASLASSGPDGMHSPFNTSPLLLLLLLLLLSFQVWHRLAGQLGP
jgi:hypothetical protein